MLRPASTLLAALLLFACGQRRFRIERIDVWETGETVYSELPPAR